MEGRRGEGRGEGRGGVKRRGMGKGTRRVTMKVVERETRGKDDGECEERKEEWRIWTGTEERVVERDSLLWAGWRLTLPYMRKNAA